MLGRLIEMVLPTYDPEQVRLKPFRVRASPEQTAMDSSLHWVGSGRQWVGYFERESEIQGQMEWVIAGNLKAEKEKRPTSLTEGDIATAKQVSKMNLKESTLAEVKRLWASGATIRIATDALKDKGRGFSDRVVRECYSIFQKAVQNEELAPN
jgi:hypothetical protein